MPKQEQTKNILPTPAVKSNAFLPGSWPKAQWWKQFHSHELNKLIATALQNNPSIAEVKNRIGEARENSVIQRSELFPLLFFNTDMTFQYLSKNGLLRALNPDFNLNHHPIDLGLSFTYEFDFWYKYHNLFYAALGRVAAKQAETAQVKLIVTTALAQAFFSLKTNLIRQSLYKQLYQVNKNLVDLHYLLLRKSLNNKLTPLLAEERLWEVKKLLENIDDEIATDKHLINILAGRGPDTPIPVTSHLAVLPKTLHVPKHLSLDLIARRPDLMAQIWYAKALAYEVGAAKADFYPNVNLLVFAGLSSISYSQLFTANSLTPASFPSIHLPLFTAGSIKANVKKHKAEFDAAISNYNTLVLKSVQEVADVLAFAQAVYQKKQEQNRIVNNANKRYKLSLLLKRKGLDNSFDVLHFKEQLLEKKLTNVMLLYNQYLATVKLIKALGGGYHNSHVPLRRKS